jgi:hypothetical protein
VLIELYRGLVLKHLFSWTKIKIFVAISVLFLYLSYDQLI